MLRLLVISHEAFEGQSHDFKPGQWTSQVHPAASRSGASPCTQETRVPLQGMWNDRSVRSTCCPGMSGSIPVRYLNIHALTHSLMDT